MQQYHQHFPQIDSVKWTEYFLKEFMPKHKFFEKTSNVSSSYVEYHGDDFINDVEIFKLSSLLTNTLKFPPIQYFLIFRHIDMDQPIHADGQQVLRNASFNLPLLGYEGTKMHFYTVNDTNIKSEVSNANYFNANDVTLVEEFQGGNEWVLVDSSIPHNVVNMNSDNPRLTLCIRFFGNPTFQDLVKNAKS